MWTNAIYQVVPYIEALIHAFIYRDPDKMQNLVEADYVTFAISPEPDGEWMRAVDRMLRERLLSLVPLWRILSSQAQKFPIMDTIEAIRDVFCHKTWYSELSN